MVRSPHGLVLRAYTAAENETEAGPLWDRAIELAPPEKRREVDVKEPKKTGEKVTDPTSPRVAPRIDCQITIRNVKVSSETPLKSLDDAKVFFQAARCNRYFMEFASDERLAEYEALTISEATEHEWAVEYVCGLATQLESGNIGLSELSWKHSNLEEVILGWRFDHFLPLLLTVTNSIAPRLQPLARIIVAETILGRQEIQYRPGPVLRCTDCGQRDTAIEFANVVHRLASTPFKATELEERRIKSIQRLARTREMCNLSPR